jgi:hypothetical protein
MKTGIHSITKPSPPRTVKQRDGQSGWNSI